MSGTCPDVRQFTLSDHAQEQMQRRGIPETVVARVLRAPEQRAQVRPGRCVYQMCLALGTYAGDRLVRVFVDIDRVPVEVVTVYVTSKIDKYRRAP